MDDHSPTPEAPATDTAATPHHSRRHRGALALDAGLTVLLALGSATAWSRGMTMTELASLMVDLGATTAYNLDGGGSSEMWFNGEVVNRPSTGSERATSDILYIRSGS